MALRRRRARVAVTCRSRWPRSSAGTAGCTRWTATPLARDEVAARGGPQPGDRHHPGRRGPPLPEPVDLAFCRFLLLHVFDPAVVLAPDGRRREARRLGGGPGAGHHGRSHRRRRRCPCPTPATPTSGRCCPRWCRDAGLERGRRLGGGARRGGSGTGRALPRGADRGRPRRRPRRPPPLGDRRRAPTRTRGPPTSRGQPIGSHPVTAPPPGMLDARRRRASSWPSDLVARAVSP